MENPSFEPDEFTPQSLSPVEDKKKSGADNGIFMTDLTSKAIDENEDYDPYENRVVKKPTTDFETILHLLKGSLGTGILAMPRAFHNSGYVVGTVGTILIGLLCTYCIHILLDSCYVLCKRRRQPSMSYPALAEAAFDHGPNILRGFSRAFMHTVNVFLLIYQIGTCCVYVVFVSENIKAVIHESLNTEIDVKLVMCAILLPLVLINWVRDLKYLAPLSAIANIVTLISFGGIMYYLFKDAPTLEGRHPVGILTNFPLFFGTVLFALEAIGVILPLENEMKTPKHFVGKFGVLNISMAAIVFLYVLMGLAGYLRFGEDAAGSITLNLPRSLISQAVQGALAFAIFVTHGLACYVAIDITWNQYIGKMVPNSNIRWVWEYLVRTGVVLITFALAAAVPELDLFISLFGALCLSALGLAFPALIQTCTYWHHVSKSARRQMVIKNVLVFIVGFLGLVVGTYTSLQGIVEKFLHPIEATHHHNTTEILPFINATLNAFDNSTVNA